MTIEKMNEFKSFMTNAGEATEGIEEFFNNDKKDLLKLSDYMQNLRKECKAAIRTLTGNEKEYYTNRLNNLTKALEIIYLFA